MNRQKEVLECFNGDKNIELSKQEIIQKAKLYYFNNTEKHAGDVLSRMVKSGLLKRVKKGVYSLGIGIKKPTISLQCNCEKTFYEWEKEVNKCYDCGKFIII